MNKKYYDGGIVTEILFTHLEPEKMLEVLTAFAEVKGVDVVPVIRCRECKWWTEQEESMQGRCALLGMYPTGAWYCANGAKMDEVTE